MIQEERIRTLLERGRTITQLQAARWKNPVLRLGAIIFNLRKRGYNIVDLNKGKKRFSKYKLEE